VIPVVTAFDYWLSQTLNQAAQQSPLLDRLLESIAVTHPLKGGIMMLAVWWLWFHKRDNTEDRRAAIICMLLGVTASIVVTKIVIWLTPFRPRPLYNVDLHLVVPAGVDASYLDKLSSFPSDHASLFIALAFGFFYVSRRLGWTTLVYSLLLICLPRVFLGFHYASDVAVGGAIGMTCVLIAQRPIIRSQVKAFSSDWLRFHPASFYCCLFTVTYQIVNQFDEARAAGHLLIALAKGTPLT
jgi:undecaprenyl-diphosphatase